MKYLLKLEELSMFGLSIFLFAQLDLAWWWYPLLFFAPDLSALGYLVNPRVGTWTYNAIHFKAISIGLYILGALLANPPLQLVGQVLLGHSSFDRMLGYGLKYPDAFKNTHLGNMGEA